MNKFALSFISFSLVGSFSTLVFAENSMQLPNELAGEKPPFQGYELLDVEKGGLFEKAGLKAGDVIKSYDGQPIDNVQKAMELYNQLKKQKKVQMEIERNGQTQQINQSAQAN